MIPAALDFKEVTSNNFVFSEPKTSPKFHSTNLGFSTMKKQPKTKILTNSMNLTFSPQMYNSLYESEFSDLFHNETHTQTEYTKLEAEISKKLQSLNFDPLFNPKNTTNLYTNLWNTFETEPPSFESFEYDENQIETDKLNKFEHLEKKLFSVNEPFFSQHPTDAEKKEQWLNKKAKLQQKKLERQQYNPKFIYKNLVSSLSFTNQAEAATAPESQKETSPSPDQEERMVVPPKQQLEPTMTTQRNPVTTTESHEVQESMIMKIIDETLKLAQILGAKLQNGSSYYRNFEHWTSELLKQPVQSDVLFELLRNERETLHELINYRIEKSFEYYDPDTWCQLQQILRSLQASKLQEQYPFTDGTHICSEFFNNCTQLPIGKDQNFLKRKYIEPGVVVNPPFSKFELFLLKALHLSVTHKLCIPLIAPFNTSTQWFEKLHEHKVPIIYLSTPVMFAKANKKLIDYPDKKIMIILVGAKGESVTVQNSPNGTFYLPTEWADQIELPPPPLEHKMTTDFFQKHFLQEYEKLGYEESVQKLQQQIVAKTERITRELERTSAKGKFSPMKDLFETEMAENVRDVLTQEERLQRNNLPPNILQKGNPFFSQTQHTHTKKVHAKPLDELEFRTPSNLSKENSKAYQLIFGPQRNQQQQQSLKKIKENPFYPPSVPPLLQHTELNEAYRTQVNNFHQIRTLFPQKFNLTSNPTLPCQSCGQTSHSRQGCWKNPITFEALKSNDERDKFFIKYMRQLPQLQPLKPPETGITGDWFINTFWPEMLQREIQFFTEIKKAFKKKFPQQTFNNYLDKFKILFSRLWWGMGFAHALGINRETILRSTLGIPRHNVLETPPYEINQKRSPKIEKLINEMHLKKVAEGKLLYIPGNSPFSIFPLFLIDEKDKVRMIQDAFFENIVQAKQNVKMTKIKELFYESTQSIAMTLDIMSAYDQVPSTPAGMLYQGTKSKDSGAHPMYFIWTAICQGKSIGPKRCQGHFSDLLSPSKSYFDAIKLYIDDIMALLDRTQHSQTDLIIIFKSLLLMLHKLGIRISPKLPPEMTTTPPYLGYIMNFQQQNYVPQPKHIYKLSTLLLKFLSKSTKLTFRDCLSLKGTANFIFGPTCTHLFHDFDDYIKINHFCHNRKIETILNDEIPLSPKLYKIIHNITQLYSNLDTFTFTPKKFEKKSNQVLVVTDSGPTTGGGFTMINGKDFHHSLHDKPIFQKSYNMHSPSLDYRLALWEKLSASSTDMERKAALLYLSDVIPQIKSKFPELTPSNTDFIFLTDSKTLNYQINDTLNTTPIVSCEIKRIKALCSTLSSTPKYFWHPRNTSEGQLADAMTRESDMFLNEQTLTQLQNHFQSKTLTSKLSQKNLNEIQIHDPFYKYNTETSEQETLLVFPSPSTANKQIFTILECLKWRKHQGIIILPKIDIFQSVLNTSYFKAPYNLGKLESSHFVNIPTKLQRKKFDMIAYHFDFSNV